MRKSGTGKTSIFNAQVIPMLRITGFDVLPTARVLFTSVTGARLPSPTNTNGKSSKIKNLYVFNTMQSLGGESQGVDPASFLNLSLFEFLDGSFPNRKDAEDRGASSAGAPYLIN